MDINRSQSRTKKDVVPEFIPDRVDRTEVGEVIFVWSIVAVPSHYIKWRVILYKSCYYEAMSHIHYFILFMESGDITPLPPPPWPLMVKSNMCHVLFEIDEITFVGSIVAMPSNYTKRWMILFKRGYLIPIFAITFIAQ